MNEQMCTHTHAGAHTGIYICICADVYILIYHAGTNQVGNLFFYAQSTITVISEWGHKDEDKAEEEEVWLYQGEEEEGEQQQQQLTQVNSEVEIASVHLQCHEVSLVTAGVEDNPVGTVGFEPQFQQVCGGLDCLLTQVILDVTISQEIGCVGS